MTTPTPTPKRKKPGHPAETPPGAQAHAQQHEAIVEAFHGWMLTHVGRGNAEVASVASALAIPRQIQMLNTHMATLDMNAEIVRGLLARHCPAPSETPPIDIMSALSSCLDALTARATAAEGDLAGLRSRLLQHGIDAEGKSIDSVIASCKSRASSAAAEVVVLQRRNEDLLRQYEDLEATSKERVEDLQRAVAELREELTASDRRRGEVDRNLGETVGLLDRVQKRLDETSAKVLELETANAGLSQKVVRLPKESERKGPDDPAVAGLMSKLQRRQANEETVLHDVSGIYHSADDAKAEIARDLKSVADGSSNPDDSLGARMRTYMGSFRGAFELGAELWESFPDALDDLQTVRKRIEDETTVRVSSDEVRGILLFAALCTKDPQLLRCRLPFRPIAACIPRLFDLDLDLDRSDRFGRAFRRAAIHASP